MARTRAMREPIGNLCVRAALHALEHGVVRHLVQDLLAKGDVRTNTVDRTLKPVQSTSSDALTARIDMSETVDKVSEMIAHRRPGTVQIVLRPEELGTVQVTVRQIGEAFRIDLQASDERAGNHLQSRSAELVQQIEARGHQVTSVNVSSDQNLADTRNGQAGQQSQAFDRNDFEQSARLRAGFAELEADRVIQRHATFSRPTDRAVDYVA